MLILNHTDIIYYYLQKDGQLNQAPRQQELELQGQQGKGEKHNSYFFSFFHIQLLFL